MIQAFERGLRSLRRVIRNWLCRLGWRPAARAVASERLAQDLGLPTNAVSDILDSTVAELRKLADKDGDNLDARPIIDRAVQQLGRLGFNSPPLEEAIMDRYLRELPERDYQILRYFKQGRKHREIAELLGTNLDSVRCSLVRTYADLRIRMLSGGGGGDGGIPAAAQSRASSFNAPLQQTSVRT